MSELQSLAKDIAQCHVRHVFGIPGSGPSLTLLDALEKEGVPFYLTHFEGTGALMAGAVGRLSGKAGVAVSIKGPGLANMVPGLAACYLEAWPIVSLSESYLPGAPLWNAHKRLDHDGILAKVTKGSRIFSQKGPQFSDLSEWAEHEVPGPVHLNISDSLIGEDRPVSCKQDRRIDPVSLQTLTEIIDKSHRPVVIAGTFGIRQGISAFLNNLTIFNTKRTGINNKTKGRIPINIKAG